MFIHSWNKIWTAVIVIFINNKFVFCQSLSCSKIFKFNHDGSDWFGIVDLIFSPLGQPFRLKVEMALNGDIPEDYMYVGSTDLKIKRKKTTVEYKIKFPLSSFQPELARIILNENVICAEETSDDFNIVTVLRLEQSTSGQLTFDTSVTGIEERPHVPPTSKTNSINELDQEEIRKAINAAQNQNEEIGSDITESDESDFGSLEDELDDEIWKSINDIQNQNKEIGSDITESDESDYSSLEENKEITSTNCGQLAEQFKKDPSVGKLEQGAWPWIAAVYANSKYNCVGSLITVNAVLTAATCVRHLTPNDISVYLGVEDLGKIDERLANDSMSVYLVSIDKLFGYINSSVSEIYAHKSSKPDTADGDIAILQLAEKIEFSEYIQPACLWSGQTELEDVEGEDGYYAKYLRFPQGRVIPYLGNGEIASQEDCIQREFVNSTSTRAFCVELNMAASHCVVDSGAGFLIRQDLRWILRGVISARIKNEGSHCDVTNYILFADVAQYLDWIAKIIKNFI